MKKPKTDPNKQGNKKYRFLNKEESDRLKKIMVWAGGYDLFKNKWIEKEMDTPIPTPNTYYNVINGRSLKRDVLTIIKETVAETNIELAELKESLKETK